MAGNCAIFRSWNTGDLLTASDLTTSFTTVGVTNMTPSCMDDYALDLTQFRANTDPYPAGSPSLPTSLGGELERLRYVIKKITTWSQWYAHSETVTLPTPLILSVPLGIGAAQTADAQVRLGGAFTGSTQTEAVRVNSSLTGVVGANAFGLVFTPTFIEAASGTHAQLTGLYVAPILTNAGATTTNVFGINIDTIATGAVAPTTAAALRIAAPTGGTTNLSIFVESGESRFAGDINSTTGIHKFGATPAAAGSIRLTNATNIAWRNAANNADLTLGANSSDNVEVGAHLVPLTNSVFDLGVAGKLWNNVRAVIFTLSSAAALTGSIRMQNNGAIAWRNAGNSADHLFSLNTSDQFEYTAPLVANGNNTLDLGLTGTRWRSAFFGTSVAIGTTTAAAGALRLANAVNISGRNAGNSADVVLASIDSSDRVRVGPGSTANIRMDGQTRCDIDSSARLVLPVGTDKWAV